MAATSIGEFDTGQNADGQWYWIWTSPGGAYLQSPAKFATRGKAMTAAKQYATEHVGPRKT